MVDPRLICHSRCERCGAGLSDVSDAICNRQSATRRVLSCPPRTFQRPSVRRGEMSRAALKFFTLALIICVGACVRVQSGLSLGPADDGLTRNISVGSELRLVLPADLDWTIDSTNSNALTLKSTTAGSAGEASLVIWVFDVKGPGQFVLRATGSRHCDPGSSPCPSQLQYRFLLRAQ
jgi:hypothetical protein